MGTTNFDTVAVAQALTVNGAVIQPAGDSPWATHYFVDGNRGANTNAGTAEKPFLTLAKAISVANSGDVIHIRGNIKEQIHAPVGLMDITIKGPSPVKRHPDAHTGHSTNGGYSSVIWKAPDDPTATTPLLEVVGQGWRFENILFSGNSAEDVDCVLLTNNGGSGATEESASHCQFVNCKFQGGRYGIIAVGGNARIQVIGCEFLLFSNSGDVAIKADAPAYAQNFHWVIRECDFSDNLTDLDVVLHNARITDNYFHHVGGQSVTNVVAIDETGSTDNLVARNFMYCASDEGSVVNARFVKAASSHWGPNYYSDIEEYGEPAE